MSYAYQPNDNIFDIESLSNLYVDTHYFPARHQADIYYLSDVPRYHSFTPQVCQAIRQQVLAKNYNLRKLGSQLKINFYDLRIPKNLVRYCLFWGLTPNKPSSLNYVSPRGLINVYSNKDVSKARSKNQNIYGHWTQPKTYNHKLWNNSNYTNNYACNLVTPYYTVKRTDPEYNKRKYGITMGFNSDNYDLTMIAVFLGHIVHNPYARYYLNNLLNPVKALKHSDEHWDEFEEWKSERQDLIHNILRPEFFRHYNDLLFTKYKRNMPQLLAHQPDLHVPKSENYFDLIDNPAQYIYKGWITSNRYLDVANLNEHMKFVPLKRIAAMEGWQILESKHVTANTKFITDLAQIKDLIAYNNSDVQVTKQVFELPEYQDALTLRRILLRKFPQLTYNYSRTSAFKRYLSRHPKVKQKLYPKNSTVVSLKRQILKTHPRLKRIPLLNQLFRTEEALNVKHQRGKKNKRQGLIYKYYKQIANTANPKDTVVASNNLRFSPLNDDASSAKLISNVIAPYHSMHDWPDIEFLFPDPRALAIFKAKHPEIKLRSSKPFNVLTDTLNWTKEVDAKFGLSKYPPADEAHVLDKHHSLYKTFKPIYHLYRHVEGHNANQTLEQYAGKRKLYNIRGKLETVGQSINMTKLLHQTNGNIPYLRRDGSSTGTTAVFSYGGIHGVEFKLAKYKQDYRHYLQSVKIQKVLKHKFSSHNVQTSLFSTGNAPKKKDSASAAYHAKSTQVKVNGKPQLIMTKSYLKGAGSHAQWKQLTPPQLYKHPKHSSYKLNSKYSYVSVDPVSHEDFSGYYPMLISRLGIMWPHDEPKDTYHQLYVERLHLKHELKQYTKNTPKWNDINKKQLLRKLLLNSASGAGDAKFFNTIRMNNKIISMRIMGQLFTWRMAQSVCLADKNLHAKVTSSNTDGVYLAGLPSKINDVALQKAVKPLSLFISPVPLSRFVSKDANNRAEITNYGTSEKPDNRLTEAKGATLNGWQGPSVTATISHPAIIDNVLAKYLAYQPDPCNRPLNTKVLYHLINAKRKELYSSNTNTRANGLIFFQWVIASNPNKHRYPFLMPVIKHKGHWKANGKPQPIPHTNRLFLIKPQTDINELLLATRQKIRKSSYDKLINRIDKTNQQSVKARQAGDKDRKKEADRKHDKYKDKWKQVVTNDPRVLDIYSSWGDTQAVSFNNYHSDAYSAHQYVGRLAKLPSMPKHQNILIENHSLYELSKEQVARIADLLDYPAYCGLIAQKFHASWDNNQ